MAVEVDGFEVVARRPAAGDAAEAPPRGADRQKSLEERLAEATALYAKLEELGVLRHPDARAGRSWAMSASLRWSAPMLERQGRCKWCRTLRAEVWH